MPQLRNLSLVNKYLMHTTESLGGEHIGMAPSLMWKEMFVSKDSRMHHGN